MSLSRGEWIELAKQARRMVTTAQVAEAYGIVFDRAGFAPCPFHNEKTGSFHIKNATHFHCFGCHTSPDVIDLTACLFGLSFAESLSKLDNDFALGLPIDEAPTPEQSRAMRARIAARQRAERAEKQAQGEYATLWESAIGELAEVQREIQKARPPKGPVMSLEAGKRLAVLLGRQTHAVGRLELLPDEAAFVEKRTKEILNERGTDGTKEHTTNTAPALDG